MTLSKNLIVFFIIVAHYTSSSMTPSKENPSASTTNALLLAPQPQRIVNLSKTSIKPFKKSSSCPHFSLLSGHTAYENSSPEIKNTIPFYDAYDDDSPTNPLQSDEQSLSYFEQTLLQPSPKDLNTLLMELNKQESRPPTPPNTSLLPPQNSPLSTPSSQKLSPYEEPLLITIRSAVACILQVEYTKRPPHKGLPPLVPSLEYKKISAHTLIHTILPRFQPNSLLPLTCIRLFIENKPPITALNKKLLDQPHLTIDLYEDKTCETTST